MTEELPSYIIDLKSLDNAAAITGNKELTKHVHWLMQWLEEHAEREPK